MISWRVLNLPAKKLGIIIISMNAKSPGDFYPMVQFAMETGHTKRMVSENEDSQKMSFYLGNFEMPVLNHFGNIA